MDMRLSKEAIEEFKEIYEREFGKTITDEEAQEMGQNLISLFKIIYREIPLDNDDKQNRRVRSNKTP
jgi:flagellin-specific chaperone FliS